MGVRFEDEQKFALDETEIYNPATCERLDCLNFGVYRMCYIETEGCRDYIKCDES